MMHGIVIFIYISKHKKEKKLRLDIQKQKADITAERITLAKTKSNNEIFGEKIDRINSCEREQANSFLARDSPQHMMKFLNVYLLLNNDSELFTTLKIDKSTTAILKYYFDVMRFHSISSPENGEDCIALAMKNIMKQAYKSFTVIDWENTRIEKEAIHLKNGASTVPLYTQYSFKTSAFSSEDYYNALRSKIGPPFDCHGAANYWYMNGQVLYFTQFDKHIYVFNIRSCYTLFRAVECEVHKLRTSHQAAKSSLV